MQRVRPRVGRALAVTSLTYALVSCGGSSSHRPVGDSVGGAGQGASAGAPSGGAGKGTATGGAVSAGKGGSGAAGTAGRGAGSGAGGSSPATGGAGTTGNGGAGVGGRAAGAGGTGDNGGLGGAGGDQGGVGPGTAGQGGSTVGGQGPAPGFPCFGDNLTCETGQRCISCQETETAYSARCAPDPEVDPDGYAASSADCIGVPRYSTCDGPEDCPDGTYCAYLPSEFGPHCVTQEGLPMAERATCCFTCDATPVCTLCWNDGDCPATLICVPQPASPRGVGGCRIPD